MYIYIYTVYTNQKGLEQFQILSNYILKESASNFLSHMLKTNCWNSKLCPGFGQQHLQKPSLLVGVNSGNKHSSTGKLMHTDPFNMWFLYLPVEHEGLPLPSWFTGGYFKQVLNFSVFKWHVESSTNERSAVKINFLLEEGSMFRVKAKLVPNHENKKWRFK